MEASKDVTLKARISAHLAESFQQICTAESKNVSVVLREVIADYIARHDIAKRNLNVQVHIGEPYGRGKHDRDEYEVSARLTGDWKGLEVGDLYFLLPEFVDLGSDEEPYRVDSFHEHRAIFPRCRNQYDRLLGAKFIKGEWKGAIFLYQQKLIDDHERCFEDIKTRLSNNVRNAISDVIKEAVLRIPVVEQ